MARVVLGRASHDSTTRRFNSWAGQVLSVVRQAGHQVTDLSGTVVTKTNIDGALQSGCDCFIFYGHGEYDRLYGHATARAIEIVVDTGSCGSLGGCIVCTVSCDSGKTLGPESVQQGARCYFGYNDLFGYVGPLQQAFRDCANLGMIKMAQSGLTAGEAKSRQTDLYSTLIGYYARGLGRHDPNALLAAAWLRWDRDSLVLLGDVKARL